VLGHQPEAIRAGSQAADQALFVVNADYELGKFSSIQCGLRVVPAGSDGAILTPVDHPNIEPATVERLIESRARIAIPQYLGRHGHPMLIARSLIPEFLALPPDSQARDITRRHTHEIHYVDVADPGVLDDIDDPEAYRRLLASA